MDNLKENERIDDIEINDYKIIQKKSLLTEINDSGENVDEEKQTALVEKVKALSENAEIIAATRHIAAEIITLFLLIIQPPFYREREINLLHSSAILLLYRTPSSSLFTKHSGG